MPDGFTAPPGDVSVEYPVPPDLPLASSLKKVTPESAAMRSGFLNDDEIANVRGKDEKEND